MLTVAGESLPKGKPGPGTPWLKQPAVFWVKSQLFRTQELATTTKKPVITSGFSWFGSVLKQFLPSVMIISLCLRAMLILCSEMSTQSHFLEGISFSGWKICLTRRVLWHWPGVFCPWLHGDVWASKNAKIVGKRLGACRASPYTPWTSQAGHAGAASQKSSWEQRRSSQVCGCRLKPSFLYRLAWYFFFPPTPLLFPLHPWGTESTKDILVEVAFSDTLHSLSMLRENKTGASLNP